MQISRANESDEFDFIFNKSLIWGGVAKHVQGDSEQLTAAMSDWSSTELAMGPSKNPIRNGFKSLKYHGGYTNCPSQ
jgi:hypothetical protein